MRSVTQGYSDTAAALTEISTGTTSSRTSSISPFTCNASNDSRSLATRSYSYPNFQLAFTPTPCSRVPSLVPMGLPPVLIAHTWTRRSIPTETITLGSGTTCHVTCDGALIQCACSPTTVLVLLRL